jgi:hypothetical protein
LRMRSAAAIILHNRENSGALRGAGRDGGEKTFISSRFQRSWRRGGSKITGK